MVPARTVRVLDEPVHTVPVAPAAQLVGAVREGRGEISCQSALLRYGNLPYPEEPEYVVDAEGVEVFAHLAQTGLPPGVAVLGHLFPVVGREAPVLAVGREGVRRCAGLGIHVEEFRKLPGIRAGAGYPYREVTLEDHAFAVGVVADLAELCVQVELEEAVEVRFAPVAFVPALETGFVIDRKFTPLAEVRSPEFIAEGAETGIWDEPLAVCCEEVPVGLGAGEGFPVCVEGLAEQAALLPVDAHIVGLGASVLYEGVELLLQFEIFLVHGNAGGRQVYELRVQSEGRVGVVRIGVVNGPEHRGVVDRQELQEGLACEHGPVHHLLQVQEFSHPEVILTPEGEHRNRGSGALPARAVAPAVKDFLPFLRCFETVQSPLVAGRKSVADDFVEIFALCLAVEELLCRELHAPFSVRDIGHRPGLSGTSEHQVLAPAGMVFDCKFHFLCDIGSIITRLRPKIIKKNEIRRSHGEPHTNHIINNTKTNNQSLLSTR